jgi:hypothetical protein
MKTLEIFDNTIGNIMSYLDQRVYDSINLLIQNPDLAQMTAAAIIASPIVGLVLKTQDRDKIFFLSSLTRLTGATILYGSICALSMASVSLSISYLRALAIDYEYYSEAYMKAFVFILDNSNKGALIGLVIAAIVFVFSRTAYTKFLSNLESKIKWSTELPLGVPTEEDIKRLKVKKVSQFKLKRWLKKAHAKEQVFLGIDHKRNKPIFIPLETALADCWQVSGQPGAGKGVFNQLLFSQFIQFGHVNVIFNPKKDAYARSSLFNACKEASKPFYRIDLTLCHPSINVFAGCTAEEIFEILCSGFGFENTPKESNFYAAVSRRIIREVTEYGSPKSIPEFLEQAQTIFDDVGKNSANLNNKLTELALLKATQTEDARPLLDVFERGGCLLIEGTPNNESVLTLMKMLHVRVVQLASCRGESKVPVNIWIDESRHILCPSVITGLGTSRSFDFRYSLTTQSNADFEAAHLSFPPKAVRQIINDDTPSRVLYSTQDYDTTVSISEHCGTQEGLDSSNLTSLNELATETANGERRVSKSEGPIFHPNLIKGLPKGVAIITGAVRWATMASIPPLIVEKIEIPAYQAKPLNKRDTNCKDKDELL